jgi:hypothetical protein
MKGSILSLLFVAFAWAVAANAQTDVKLNTALQRRYLTVEYTKSAGLNWEPVYWYFYFWLSDAANKLPATQQIWGGYLWPGPHYGLITLLGRLAPPFHGLGIVVLARKIDV